MNSYFYPVFTELPAQSFDSFLGELGGIFDFWLGASVIGLVHLVVYVVKQVVNVSRKGTKTGYTVRAMLNKSQPTAVLIPAAVAVNKNTSDQNLHDRLKAVKEKQDFNELCSIVEEQLYQLSDQVKTCCRCCRNVH